MTMLTPDDPGSGRLFFWTRQGISLQQLYDIIDEAVAASGGAPAPPGGTVSGGDINAINILDSTDVGRSVLTAVGTTFVDRQVASRAAMGAASSVQVDGNSVTIASQAAQIGTLTSSMTTVQTTINTPTATALARVRIPIRQVGSTYPTPLPSGFYGYDFEGQLDPRTQAGITVNTNIDKWTQLP